MRRAVIIGPAIALSLLAGPPPASAQDALQPYQLVRSLQLVQDRIAAGDHAALPMQAKLLEMTDARLRAASPEDFKDPKNFRALLVYGMSGGNPITVEAAASRAIADPQARAIAKGVTSYLNGQPAAAIEALKPIDPMALPSDLGAFVALVKGSLLATDEPAAALVLLDDARLLGPGTLVEEAALRRSVGIAAAQQDAARFALASTQYVERYLYSPYASQFADSFVSGVIVLHMAISQDKLADITSMMDPEREKVIYLRIARRAAIDGLNDLSAFASAKAGQGRNGLDNENDPRALLYASLSTVTSDTADDVRAKLKKIDRGKLSEGDRALLDAVQAVAGEVIAPPKAAVVEKPAPVKPAIEAAVAETPDASGLPPVEGAISEMPATVTPVGAAGAVIPISKVAAVTTPGEPAPTAQAQAGVDPNDPADATMIKARKNLDMIDQILGAAPK
jgi:chemotaxis protein MotC